METMGHKEILRAAMDTKGMKQTILAERMGVKQTSISSGMRRDKIGLDVFAKMLGEMGYDVLIVDKETGETQWRVATK